jgi:MSHA biogenesis protein MshL
MRIFILSCVVLCSLSACSSLSERDTYDKIRAEFTEEIKQLTQAKADQAAQAEAVARALLPPLAITAPKPSLPQEERFNVSFNQVPAVQFFMSIVADTKFNILVHPEVSGNISANLKDVTLFEALDAIREVYGYDYKVEGTRIYIRPLTLQTRVFYVNYLTGSRRGSSEIRVMSGQNNNNNNNNNNSNGNNNNNNNGGNIGGNNGGNNNNNNNNNGNNGSNDSSRISTSTLSDFWSELRASLEAIVGQKPGRSVVVSPQSGVVVVSGMPDELRNIEMYLKATQVSVDRQVILEAKILEVQLNNEFQSGINWAAFNMSGNNRFSVGSLGPGAALGPLIDGVPSPLSGGLGSLSGTPGVSLANPSGAIGSLFGLAFQTTNFAALITFLESQGTVHVLSSPRIATLNNQKAVLKIGTDEFFVTNVSTTTVAGAGTQAATVTPNVTLQSFFSGVVLDVTPQIDDQGNITLHVHPQVSQVATVTKRVDLGSGGALNLPLASSNTSETDSVVRGKNGRIVAIGGLMRQSTVADRSQVPGLGSVPGVGALFRNTGQSLQKRELVILLKPTIVENDDGTSQELMEVERRINSLRPPGRGE